MYNDPLLWVVTHASFAGARAPSASGHTSRQLRSCCRWWAALHICKASGRPWQQQTAVLMRSATLTFLLRDGPAPLATGGPRPVLGAAAGH
jgi:hypothetical protein